jgi:CheY-like chemotaxis protein
MFCTLLKNLNQDATSVYSGGAALALARELRPRIAFLDMAMPEMSGAELAKRLRAEFPPSELTLIGVSGHSKAHAAVRDADVDQYLLKPVSSKTLIELLNSIS